MKAVLISTRPEWCEKEASGEKNVEIRKTRPKLNPPFKVYIYCTKNTKKNALHTYIRSGYGRKEFGIIEQWRSGKEVVDVNAHLPAYRYNAYLAEGKVIGEFVCCRIDKIGKRGLHHNFDYCYQSLNQFGNDDIEIEITDIQKSCISKKELNLYGESSPYLLAWHISDLKIYEKPMALYEFYHKCEKMACEWCEHLKYQQVNSDERDYDCEYLNGNIPLSRPPQSWCYVEEVTP